MAAALQQWTPRDILAWTTDFLSNRQIEPARLTGERLLAFALGITRVDIYLDFDRPLAAEERAAYKKLLLRRVNGEPLQYILGDQAFRYVNLLVRPGVLIPRPETEILVEEAMGYLVDRIAERRGGGCDGERRASGRDVDPLKILDIGTGSGAIALSLAHETIMREIPAEVTAVDISDEALRIAEENATLNKLSDRVKFMKSDLTGGIEGTRFDLVISNPPYIRSADIAGLAGEVRDFEPHLALDGGVDGLDVIRRLVDDCPGILHRDGSLMIEIGFDQSDEVISLLKGKDWRDPVAVKDLSGVERVIIAQVPAGSGDAS